MEKSDKLRDLEELIQVANAIFLLSSSREKVQGEDAFETRPDILVVAALLFLVGGGERGLHLPPPLSVIATPIAVVTEARADIVVVVVRMIVVAIVADL